MTKFFCYTIHIILPLIIIPYINAQPLFEVERESFCRYVKGHEPVDPFLEVAEIKRGEGIFFWMEVKAGERALTMLEAKGELPIYHAWASDTGVTDIINIGIGKGLWEEKKGLIGDELRRRGFFTWRTQSFKRNLKEGRWYISILDANKKPVFKIGAGREALRPQIIIRFIDK